ncbi:MAG: methionyl-tRNA formyltransferase, partial [Cucumibacter sp.]
LHDEMMRRGADLMARALAALERGVLEFTSQPETGVTYARKISNPETRIDWSRPAAEIHNHIRGLSPVPGAWFTLKLHGEAVRVKALRASVAEGRGAPGTVVAAPLTVACGQGAVRLTRVQREGKVPTDVDAFVRGTGPLTGLLLP